MNLYKQYLEVKNQNANALVFYRVGDFYELFGQDAIVASKLLDLTLTSRDCGLPERVHICGVPYHCVDSYVAKLIQEGCKVAICEPQNELPKVESEPIKIQGRLNLTATGIEQTILKEYLEKNASDVLTDKINNGVRIVKDGKTFINKKTLETFLAYACEEARKISEKGARAACIKSDAVFGWAIHYFEEDSIEGTLYNEDGSEYKPKPAPRTNSSKTITAAATFVSTPKEKPKTQFSLFDMLDQSTVAEPKAETTAEIVTDLSEDDEPETEADELQEDDTTEPPDEAQDGEEDYPKGLHQVSETEWADADGVIYEVTETKQENIPSVLTEIFGNTLIAR